MLPEEKKIVIWRRQGKALVVGPQNMPKTLMLLAIVFESLRYTCHIVPKRNIFMGDIKEALAEENQRQPEKKGDSRLTRLTALLNSREIKIKSDISGNYLFSIGKGNYANSLNNLVGEINESLKDEDFLQFINEMTKFLTKEIDQKLMKEFAARLTVAHTNPSLANLRLNPDDRRHTGIMDCFDRIAGPFIQEQIEKALTEPQTAKAL